ncbi:MAG: type II secretion system F family protein [Candidatus Omnitrophota bacterium]|nr:type II secretion system F family protein [Candidatus Omnitrophota bacterium]
MPETLLLSLISVMVFASVATLTWAVMPDETRRLVRRRIFSEVSAVNRPSLLTQVGKLLEPINKRLPTRRYCEQMTQVLEAAGMRIPPLHFLVVQEIGIVTGILLYFILMGRPINVAWLLLFAIAGFFVPVVWLHNQIKARRLTVGRDLPEVVDLLALCVGAGGDFMGALSRIVREFRVCPVRDELGILLQEVRVGKRRRDALRAFATRLKCPEASTFARTLIQVDRMGTGLSEALIILSEDMRLQRYHWAERFAQQAPLKMLIPLIFSLGAAMVIVAGPILIQFFRGDLLSPKLGADQQGAGAEPTISAAP